MARAPRRNPKKGGANGTAPSSGGPKSRARGKDGRFAPASPAVANAPAQPAGGGTLPPGFQIQTHVGGGPERVEHPGVPPGSHVVSGGPERTGPAEAVAGEGAQTPEAVAARDRADDVLSDLFAKYEGVPEAVGTGSDGTGLAVVGNAGASENGQPLGAHDPNQAPPAQPAQAQPVEPASNPDAELLLEPMILPGDEPALAGVPTSGDPALFHDPTLTGGTTAAAARHAMERVGFLPSELDAMDDATLIARGGPIQQRLAQDDDAYRRLRTGESAAAPAPAQAPAEPAPTGVPADDVQAVLEPLLEPLGEEGVAAVKKLFEAHVKPLATELAALKQGVKQESQERVEGLVAESRKSWVGRFPQLQNGKVAGLVRQRMKLLAQDPQLMTPGVPHQEISDRIMLAACLSMGLNDTGQSRRRTATRETRRRKTAGTQPVGRTQKPAPEESPLTHEQRQDAILFKLFGGDIQGARDYGVRSAQLVQ